MHTLYNKLLSYGAQSYFEICYNIVQYISFGYNILGSQILEIIVVLQIKGWLQHEKSEHQNCLKLVS